MEERVGLKDESFFDKEFAAKGRIACEIAGEEEVSCKEVACGIAREEEVSGEGVASEEEVVLEKKIGSGEEKVEVILQEEGLVSFVIKLV